MSADDEARRKVGKPCCDAAAVVRFVNQYWTLPGGPIALSSVRALNSYDDLNFFAETTDGTHRYVLKVHNGLESQSSGLLAAQTAMMRHLTRHGVVAPVPMRTDKSLTHIGSINDDARSKKPINDDVAFLSLTKGTSSEDGRETHQHGNGHSQEHPTRFHAVRVLSFVEGTLAERSDDVRHSPEFLRDVGAFLGKLSVALETFHHPGAERTHLWDNANVLQVKRFIGVIKDETNLEVALNVLNDFERIVAPHARALRRGCCHGDLNDQNVLVTIVSPSVADDFFSPGQRPVSKKALPWAVLDFGDIVVTWIVNEIAVAAAYFSLGNDDPVGACCEIVTGYESQFELTETERRVLPTLIQSRLVCSVVLGAFSASQDKSNEQYLLLTQKPGWAALKKMRRCGDETFRERMRVSKDANTRGEPIGGVTKWIETR